MEFKDFCVLCDKTTVTKGNNDRTAVVAEFLSTVPADEIIIVTNYMAGRLFPAADPRVIGMAKEGAKVLVSSITGEPESKVIEALRSNGDLGLIIESLLNAKPMRFTEPTGLTVKQVSDMFASIASTDGSGSKASKIKAISDLLTNAFPIEAKYVVRLVTGEMPNNVGDNMIAKAAGIAFNVDGDLVDRDCNIMGDIGAAVLMAKTNPAELKNVVVEYFRPYRPMLALATKNGITEISGKQKKTWWGEKYDGERLELHRVDDKMKCYTRNMRDITDSLELVGLLQAVEFALPKKCIVDGEVLARSIKTGRAIPFNNILKITKKKVDKTATKKDDEALADISVVYRIFDVLRVGDEIKTELPFLERQKVIDGILKENDFVKREEYIYTDDMDKVNEFFVESVANGNEGLIGKDTTTPYNFGERNYFWMKVKEKLDTLDLTIIAAEYGSGDKAGKLSSYYMGALAADGGYVCVGKVSSGVTDAGLAEVTERLKDRIISEEGNKVHVTPGIIIEIVYEEVQDSPTYDSGKALRFPVIKGIRYDKDVCDSFAKICDVQATSTRHN